MIHRVFPVVCSCFFNSKMASADSSAWASAAGAASGTGPETIGSPGLETSKEIYTYQAPWDVYALAVSNRPGSKYEHRYAVGSYVEEYNNKVQVCALYGWRFVGVGTFRGKASKAHQTRRLFNLKMGAKRRDLNAYQRSRTHTLAPKSCGLQRS